MNQEAKVKPSSLPLPPVLEAKLADFRRRVWVVKLLEGVLAAVLGLLMSWALVFLLDRVMETPGWLRGVLLIAGSLGLGLILPLKWHRWVWKQRRLEDAARLLRRTFPRLGDQLLGIVELARAEDAAGRSERLVQAAMAQAAESVKDADFSAAVPEDRHGAWGWAAGSVGAVALAAFLLVPGAAWNAVVRWLTPWREVERYTFAKVEPLPEKLVVPYAEPFDLSAKLRTDTEWSPESGKVRVQGQPVIQVPKAEERYAFSLPPQKEKAEMWVSIGDVREAVEVLPTPRPEMVSLAAELTLPGYLEYETKPVLEARSGSITLLDEAQAVFRLKASRKLASARMNGVEQPVAETEIVSKPALVSKLGEVEFSWVDVDGLTAREPLRLRVQAVSDQGPNVIARRDSQEQVFLDTEVVTFDVDVSDDFGVKRVGIEWRPVDETLPAAKSGKGEKVAAAGAPETKAVTARATFSAVKEGVAPQSIEIRAWAEDYKPGRERAYSPGFVIHLLSKDEHAIWMTDQFGKWLQAARETYEQEQRLHETNRELRELTEAELDRPENRRRISQQAAAEENNRDRLNALNQVGRKLVEQATRNDSFDAARLETWANMLRQLKDIAANKMPSVAAQLKKAASAAGQSGQGGQKAPGEQKGAQAQSGQPQGPKGEQAPNGQQAQKGEQGQPGESEAGKPQKMAEGSSGKSEPAGPKVTQGEQEAGKGKGSQPEDDGKPKPKTPSLADNEKSFFKPDDEKKEEEKAEEKGKPSGGQLGLPSTSLGAAPEKPEKKPEEPAQDSPARQELDKAIAEQKGLLDAFAKVSDQLRDLLASLEASTFVKRLKGASKKQMAIAQSLNSSALGGFGLDKESVSASVGKASLEVAARQTEQSSVVRVIQSDLEAYFQRKQDMRFKNLLDQMKKVEVVAALQRVADEAGQNWSGRSISASEYWADTLDRWAEELVGAAESSNNKQQSGESASLPPEIVLKVMQILHDEMKLRDETREAEAAKPALDKKEYFKRGVGLALKQDELGRRTFEVAREIAALPNADKFGKEMQLLGAVTSVMKDAYEILDKPQTGPEAIAAETEAIELLLQTRRQGKGGGGGGGGDPGGGSTAEGGMTAALSEIGPGADLEAQVTERQVGQSTGKAGKEAPEEYRSGLDAYFNALEKEGGGQ